MTTGSEKGATARRLGGQTAFLVLGNLFTLALGFPFQIYVARVLGAADLGVFSLIEGAMGIIAGLVAFGIAPTLVRFIPEHLERGEYSCVRELLTRGALILGIGGILTYVAVVMLLPFGMRWWPQLVQHERLVMIMALLIPVGLLLYFLQQGLRAFQEIRFMVIGSSVLQLTVKVLLTVVLFSLGLGLTGYGVAILLSMLSCLAWMLIGLRRKVAAMPQQPAVRCADKARAWRGYAGVMYGNSLFGLGSGYMDRFMIGILAGASPVGVLAVVKQLQQMPVMFLQMLLAVVAPMFSAARARGDRAQSQLLFNLTTDWVFRAALPLLLFLLLFARPMLNLYGEEFAQSGGPALWVLVVAQGVNLACGPVGNLLDMSGLEKAGLKITVYTVLLTLVGFALLVPGLGLTGAAIAIAAGIIFSNLAALLVAKRQLGIVWWDARYLAWIMPSALALLAGGLLRWLGGDAAGAWFLAAALGILYVVFHGVSLLRGLNEEDRQLLVLFRERLGLTR